MNTRILTAPALLLGLAAPATHAQSVPTSATAPTTATQPETTPATTAGTRLSPAVAIEQKLANPNAGTTWNQKPLAEALSALQAQMNVNVAVNWPALEAIGLTRETPVSFRARGISHEQTLRILLDGLATSKGRLNYAVGDEGGGLLEISTMEAFARDRTAKFFPAKTLMAVTTEGASINTSGIARPKPEVLLETLERELADAGEPAKNFKITYDPRAGRILYAGSARGQRLLERLFPVLSNPARPGTVPAPAIMPGLAKQTAEKLREKVAAPEREHTLDEFALYLSDVGKIHALVMPGAVDPALKHKLDAAERTLAAAVEDLATLFEVSWEISRDGLVVFARKDQLAWHAVLCGYDVRETIKTLAKDGGPTKAATAIVAAVKANVKEATGVAMVDGVLLFRAPDSVHRDFTRRFDTIVRDRKNP